MTPLWFETPVSMNLDGYDAPIIEWDQVAMLLRNGLSEITQPPGSGGPDRHTAWLATTNVDGSPHVVPVGALMSDRGIHFNSGPGTRKARNLARDARCSITIATRPFDLVIDGKAQRVTDDGQLHEVAAEYAIAGWQPEVVAGALTATYSAPGAGPPPWYVFQVEPLTVFAFGTAEPGGATKFTRSGGSEKA